MNPESARKIRAALGGTAVHSELKRRIGALTNAELEEAERLERLGARRVNTLRVIRATRYSRQGRGDKMLRLRVEAKL